MATDVWQQLPSELKRLNNYNFTQKVKRYFLTKQFHN